MDHFIFQFIGTLLLPVFIVAVTCSVMGIRSEAVLMPLFSTFGMALKLFLQLALSLVRIMGGTVMLTIARLLNVR